ncbi:sugar phosphate isomerase/epimerase [Salinarchaeum sp. Harcht-Bsk1]|uniref:sugar phosphate isomerase/epimerase family protein n=1 Tax=Salinarchaeum sp. Harcht-Bsk1 TaxID=1333523 RepID=UPI000677FFD0|nr:TIM barrel protein [Salinarchaeum sp. Harcht-Bsk1]
MDLGVTVGDSIDRLERTGVDFDFVEVSVGEAQPLPTDAAAPRLRSALAATESDLCMHLPFQQVVATPVEQLNDAIVEYLEDLLSWGGTVGARKAVLHATARNPYDTDLRPTIAEQLRRIAAVGEEHGVEVVVENVGHQKQGVQLSVLADLAREAEVPICFDVGHAYMEEGDDGIDRFCSRNADRISHLHVHDARSRGDTHIPIGAGEVDWSLLEEHLDDFDGTVAVEVFTDDLSLLRDSAERVTDLFGQTS